MKKILLLLTSIMLLHAEDSVEKDEQDPYENLNRVAVSYTHLTLPTRDDV